MAGDPANKADRNKKAFTAAGGNPAGEVTEANCAQAGLHDPATWAKVKDITVRDLMTLSYFHERTAPFGKMPVGLETPEGAAIISALALHTGMNYHHMKHEGGFDACCSCLG
jgi:hypothetical protein